MNKYSILLIFTMVSVLANAKDKIVLPKILSGSQIVLGASVESALKIKNSDFKLLERSYFSKIAIDSGKDNPMVSIADFNSDGLRDIAMLGYSKLNNMIFIYVALSDSSKNKYNLYEIDSFEIESKHLNQNPMYLNVSLFKNGKSKKLPVLQIETNGPGDVSVIGYYFSKKQNDFEMFNGKFD